MEILADPNLVILRGSARFNWATTFQSWKFKVSPGVMSDGDGFQLGHDFSVMEIHRGGERDGKSKKSFNWATTFQSWKSEEQVDFFAAKNLEGFPWKTT